MQKPKLDKINTIYENRFVKLYNLKYQNDFHYYLASRKDKENLVCTRKEITPDAITCIVITHMDDEDKMLLFYEYRYPIGEFVLSVPSGLCEKEEQSIMSAVKREIYEETGIMVSDKDSIEIMNPLLFSTPGFSDESTAFVCVRLHAQNFKLTNKENTGAEKVKEYTLVNKEEAKVILKDGLDHHGFYYSIATWVALSYFAYHI